MGWLSGVKLYALLGIGLVILALSGSVAFLWQVHKADKADIALEKERANQLTEALKESEADKAVLARKAQELDAAVRVRDQRARELEATKRKLADELDALRKTLPAEDQSCFARPLPDAILEVLR